MLNNNLFNDEVNEDIGDFIFKENNNNNYEVYKHAYDKETFQNNENTISIILDKILKENLNVILVGRSGLLVEINANNKKIIYLNNEPSIQFTGYIYRYISMYTFSEIVVRLKANGYNL